MLSGFLLHPAAFGSDGLKGNWFKASQLGGGESQGSLSELV